MSWGMSRPGAGPPILSFLSLWGAPLPLEQPLVLGVMLWGWGALGLECTALLTPVHLPGGWRYTGDNFLFFIIKNKTLLQDHETLWLLGRRGGEKGGFSSHCALLQPWGALGEGPAFLGMTRSSPKTPQRPCSLPTKSHQKGGKKGFICSGALR